MRFRVTYQPPYYSDEDRGRKVKVIEAATFGVHPEDPECITFYDALNNKVAFFSSVISVTTVKARG